MYVVYESLIFLAENGKSEGCTLGFRTLSVIASLNGANWNMRFILSCLVFIIHIRKQPLTVTENELGLKMATNHYDYY